LFYFLIIHQSSPAARGDRFLTPDGVTGGGKIFSIVQSPQ
jgi:hypothetical protein